MSPDSAIERPPEVRVLPSAEVASEMALFELHRRIEWQARPLVSFATGRTFARLLDRLEAEFSSGRLSLRRFVATHLDEFVDFTPDRSGGMVHELEQRCPALAVLRRNDAFWPVPASGTPAELRAHEQRLQVAGGVEVQFLGIGRNGHLAFNEPGTPFESGFHVAALTASTRDDARARFPGAEVPAHAVTAGIGTILAARHIVLCAFGADKAPAVREMLSGEIGPHCPATALRRHGSVLVLLDRQAATGLREAGGRSAVL